MQGYEDNTYRPSGSVARDAMAVYAARGIHGGMGVPAGPAEPTFLDVPSDYWAYKEIEYSAAHNVVGGYGDGTYRPPVRVTRDQMAVYMYRAFVQATAAPVVLGGPAVTASDPATDSYYGWASLGSGPAADPGYAYVVFDAARLGPELARGGTWEVKFELRDASAPDTEATGSYTETALLSAAVIEAARDATYASGEPYLGVSWHLPAGLSAGDYLLVVSAEDQGGQMNQVSLKPAFTIDP